MSQPDDVFDPEPEAPEPPADGAANDAVLALLAAALGCPRRDLTLLRGATARIKLIGIALD